MRRPAEIIRPEFAEEWAAKAARDPLYGHEHAVLHLAATIAEELGRRGLPQDELARRAGLTPSYVSRVLGRPENMTLQTAFRLCNALGLELRLDTVPKAREAEVVLASR